MCVVPPAPTYAPSTSAPSSASLAPTCAPRASASRPASVSSAPRRTHSSSSCDLTRRSRWKAGSRNTSSAPAVLRSPAPLAGKGPTTPSRTPRLPKAPSSAATVSIVASPPQRTSQPVAIRVALSTWFANWTKRRGRSSPMRDSNAASRVTGHSLSHGTTAPTRSAPYASSASAPARSNSARAASHRRAISDAENRGYAPPGSRALNSPTEGAGHQDTTRSSAASGPFVLRRSSQPSPWTSGHRLTSPGSRRLRGHPALGRGQRGRLCGGTEPRHERHRDRTDEDDQRTDEDGGAHARGEGRRGEVAAVRREDRREDSDAEDPAELPDGVRRPRRDPLLVGPDRRQHGVGDRREEHPHPDARDDEARDEGD